MRTFLNKFGKDHRANDVLMRRFVRSLNGKVKSNTVDCALLQKMEWYTTLFYVLIPLKLLIFIITKALSNYRADAMRESVATPREGKSCVDAQEV